MEEQQEASGGLREKMDYANIVPVRIEVDYDEGSSKIKDVLCWDLAGWC